jgi:hypothetical protein
MRICDGIALNTSASLHAAPGIDWLRGAKAIVTDRRRSERPPLKRVYAIHDGAPQGALSRLNDCIHQRPFA